MYIFKIIDYVFYKIYKLNLSVDIAFQKNEAPHWRAVIIFSFLLSLNIRTLFSLAFLFNSTEYFANIARISPIRMLIIFICLIFINYLYFIKDNRYIKIHKIFENENKRARMIGSVLVLLYTLLTIIILILTGIKASNLLEKI